MQKWVIIDKENFSSNEIKEKNTPIILGSGQYLIRVDENNEKYFKGYIKFSEDEINLIDKNSLVKIKNKIESKVFQTPWASKVLEDGRKIFRRKHGLQDLIPANSSKSIIYMIPYPVVKIDQVEVINCSALDQIHFKVLDSPNGSYTGYANFLLNQFGFAVNLSKDFYSDFSNYDAELFVGMQIETVYYNNDSVDKTIGFNFVLHELKGPT